MPEPIDLASLVRRAAAGDPGAEAELVEHFAPRIRAMALVRTRNRDLAGDMTQEALVALLQAFRKGQVRDYERVAGFVAGVTRNIVNNYTRRSLKHAESPLDEDAPAFAAQDDHDGPERRRVLKRALAALSPPDREVLLLTLVEGLKPGEIARKLGVSPDVARARKSRAVKRILDVLDVQSRNAVERH